MRVNVGVHVERTPEEVWAAVEDISTHTRWMADAAEIRFVGDQRSGEGTRFECLTEVGPLRTVDVMTVTRWEPPRTMGVRHEGVVVGEGAFELRADGDGTWFSWDEELRLPWRLGGHLGEIVARPLLAAVWRRNLRRLKAHVEQLPHED